MMEYAHKLEMAAEADNTEKAREAVAMAAALSASVVAGPVMRKTDETPGRESYLYNLTPDDELERLKAASSESDEARLAWIMKRGERAKAMRIEIVEAS